MKEKDILKRLTRPKVERDKFMFYLPVKLHSEFKKVCGNAPLSRVVEVLIQNFIEQSKT